MVPQKSRARICTGRWRSSSVYQIQMFPRFFTTPASAVGCTRMVLKVPSGVLITSRPSTFMVTGTLCMASTTGITKFVADLQRLRRGVEHSREQICHAAGNRGLYVLGLACDQILLIEDRLRLGVVHLERGVDLAAALDGLLVKLIGAALCPIEVRLELVAGVEEQVDGADGVGVGGELLAIAGRLKMDDCGSGGENAPVDRIGEGLVLREAEARARTGKLRERRSRGRSLLGMQERSDGESAKNCLENRALSHRWALLL